MNALLTPRRATRKEIMKAHLEQHLLVSKHTCQIVRDLARRLYLLDEICHVIPRTDHLA